MKKVMILSVMALSALAAAESAFAGPVLNVLFCRDARGGLRDAGYSVSVKHDVSLKRTFAKVSSQTIAGPREIGTYVIRQRVTHPRPGSPTVYRGEDGFELLVAANADSSGAHPSELQVMVGANKVGARLKCLYTR